MAHICQKFTFGLVCRFSSFFRAFSLSNFFLQPAVPVKNECKYDQGPETDAPDERIIYCVLEGDAGPSAVYGISLLG